MIRDKKNNIRNQHGALDTHLVYIFILICIQILIVKIEVTQEGITSE